MVILKFDKVSKIFYSKTQQTTAIADLRSEERRVGKEC